MDILYKIIGFIPLSLRLRVFYFIKFKRLLRLKHPLLYSEKIQKRKLNLLPIYSDLSDKSFVKSYISNEIGSNHVIPSITTVDTIDDLNFDLLPNKFVIKTNFGSGYNHIEIVRDKKNIDKVRIITKFKKAMKEKYKGSLLGETQYDSIPKKILVEEFMDNDGNDIDDFKFHIFNSQKGFLQIDFDRFSNHKRNLYDLNFNLLNYNLCYKGGNYNLPPMHKLEEMKDIAIKLSHGFDYVRVDLYLINDQIFFGEMTFTPGSGFEKFTPSIADEIYGEMWNQDKY
ncbi:TPA: ATP-grasp fold amidoligase family protein [Providencia stuartii]